MAKNRIEIKSKDNDGNDVVVYATRPTKEETAKAQMASMKMFREALEAKAMVRKTMDEELERQGIWNEEKQAKLESYNKEIREHLTTLKSGGIKLGEARDLAIKVRIARMNAVALQSERNEYDSYTAEAQAENAKIDYYIATCIKDESGEPYFKSIDDYRENGDQPFVNEAASKIVTMVYGVDDGWEAELPENKFLQKYKFVDESLRLVNKEGDFVTIDNKKINKDFQYVDDDGNVTDVDGVRLDDDGLPMVEFAPFLDDDGKPIIEEKPKTKKTKKVEADSAPEESAE